MKIFITKEEKKKSLITFLIIACSILFACFLYKFDTVWKYVCKAFWMFTPFYIGFAIAYLLNPIMKWLEKFVFFKPKNPKMRRGLSLVCTYIIFVGLLFSLFYFIIPGLISSIASLINNIPENIKNLMAQLNQYVEEHPKINEFYAQNSGKIAEYLTKSVEYIANAISSLIPSVVNVTVSITGALVNTFVGIVISVYMLLSKESLIGRTKKLLYGCFKKEHAEKLIDVGNITNEKMSGYIVGRITTSLIDAILIYLGCVIFKFPYPVLMAVMIGIFSIIPFFGGTIGCIPCVLIIFIQSPLKALYFLIFDIVLQQIDGNIYGPKIQGKKLNISALWIIFAILLFGGIFGFWGLLIGVPLFSVIYTFIVEYLNKELSKKGLSADTNDYIQ